MTGVAAALVVSVAACGSTAAPSATGSSSSSVSPPSSASRTPSPAEQSAAAELEKAIGATRDQAFLGILQISSLQYGDLKFADDATLVATAQKTCTDLASGAPRQSVVTEVAQNYGGDTRRADFFVTQATSTFCP
ncbi:DUF732 domain-containing protein [Williamsia herbipolensis]|uniref:DUF732 domain-containing protein n=1 Tax=Williamsia herbipolensis TaxID=1603258 RepID=A0AAU4K0H5_9NOCA|nr:DUF732 domain-containing protein [Williamsia herbipolensis]